MTTTTPAAPAAKPGKKGAPKEQPLFKLYYLGRNPDDPTQPGHYKCLRIAPHPEFLPGEKDRRPHAMVPINLGEQLRREVVHPESGKSLFAWDPAIVAEVDRELEKLGQATSLSDDEE